MHSEQAYERGAVSLPLEQLEQAISQGLRADSVLMSLKLANDQARLMRLLANPHINEELFVKLLAMYRWHDEDEDSKDDRDVIVHTLKRYVETKPNEADIHYTYQTLRRLAMEATNPRLLEVLIGFPDFTFLVRGKQKIRLREVIAQNSCIDHDVTVKLMALRDRDVAKALASNPAVALPFLEKLYAIDDPAIHEALATNGAIDDRLFEALLEGSNGVIRLLLRHQPINLHRLQCIRSNDLETKLFATLGANTKLSHEVIETLLDSDDETLLAHLASNETLTPKQLERIYAKGIVNVTEYLAINPSTPVALLEELYHTYDTQPIRIALAHNPSTPQPLLRALFERNDLEIHRAMASNGSIPRDLLDQLKVDTRLQNELAQNPILIKEYETVLDYDKKAVQF